MNNSGSLFAEALRTICEEDLQAEPFHPALEDLRAYEAEELSAEEMDRVQGHVVLCRNCTDIVLTLTGVRRQAQEARWRSSSVWRGPAYGVAAGLMVVLIASLFWLWRPQQPHANVHIESIRPSGAPVAEQRRELPSGASVQEISIPKEADSVLLILGLGEARVLAEYRLEMRNLSRSAGEVVWSTKDLRRMPAGNFSVEIPAGYLPPGDYSILLSGLEQGQVQALAEYFIRIVQAP